MPAQSIVSVVQIMSGQISSFYTHYAGSRQLLLPGLCVVNVTAVTPAMSGQGISHCLGYAWWRQPLVPWLCLVKTVAVTDCQVKVAAVSMVIVGECSCWYHGLCQVKVVSVTMIIPFASSEKCIHPQLMSRPY